MHADGWMDGWMDGWIIWIVGWMDEWIVWIWIYHVKVGKKAFRSGAEVCTSEATIRTFALRENASLFVNLLLNVSPEPVLANGRGIPSETSPPPPKKRKKKREAFFAPVLNPVVGDPSSGQHEDKAYNACHRLRHCNCCLCRVPIVIMT
jgi:hypothetical protein